MTKSIALAGIFCFILTFFLAGTVQAAEITPQRVVDHVNKAVKLIEEKGDACYPELSDPKGAWVDGDLYVFVMDFKGTLVAHVTKTLVGKSLMVIKDVKGKNFAAEFVKIALSDKGQGWCDYWWPKPGQSEPLLKVSFIKRVPGKDLLVGVGVYDFKIEDARKATGIE